MGDRAASRVFGLYGAGGFGRGVMPLARRQLLAGGGDPNRPNDGLDPHEPQPPHALPWRLVFIETAPTRGEVNGVELLSEDAFFALPGVERHYAVAIADTRARQRIAERCEARGARPLGLRAGDVTSYDEVDLGPGAILCARSMLTSNIRIGRHFHANLFSYVEHDCVIGDYVTFGPRVSCNGWVQIDDHVTIGAGALIRPGRPGGPRLHIGTGAVVGMGAVVTRDVPAWTTVVGNPARELLRQDRSLAAAPVPAPH